MIDTIRNSRALELQRHESSEATGRTGRRGQEATGSIGSAGTAMHQTLAARAPYESFDFGAVFSPPAPATLNRFIENYRVATHTITVEGTQKDQGRGEIIRGQLRAYTMRTDGGVEYTVPFRMAQGPTEVTQARNKLVEALGGDGAPGARHAPMVVLGRATPEQLREVCQALERKYPEKFKSAGDARACLQDLRVGIDCAGFVQNTLSYLTGRTPPLGLREKGTENLSQLASNPNFKPRSSPTEARPGDVITLKPTARDGVGHTLVVTERASCSGGSLRSTDYEIRGDDRLTILSVAASWGGGQGPKEKDWVYNPRTGRWGELVGNHVVASANPGGPYHHALENIWAPRY